MNKTDIDFYTRLSLALTNQFGSGCECILYDLEKAAPEQAIVHISGASTTVQEAANALQTLKSDCSTLADSAALQDRFGFLTRTSDGRILRCSAVFIRDSENKAIGLFLIRFDITLLIAMEDTLSQVTDVGEKKVPQSNASPIHINDLLEELIEQSIHLIGKPVALMSRTDKIRAVRYLNDSGALLITKSGPRICQCFGISKFTLYSYLDEIKADNKYK